MDKLSALEDPTSSSIPSSLQSSITALAAFHTSSNTAPFSKADWIEVAARSKQIADGLLTESLRTEVGQTSLAEAAAGLLQQVIPVSGAEADGAKTQLLRLFGNLCFDHHVNRALCHTAGVPSAIVQVLSTTLASSSTLSLPTLILLRSATGALLNISLKYHPIRDELRTPETLEVLLRVLDSRRTSPVYLVSEWAGKPEGELEEWKQRILVGSTIAGWSMTILNDLLSGDKDAFPSSSLPALASLLLSPHPTTPHTPSPWSEDQISTLLSTDLDLLTLSASLLESLSVDLSPAKESLAFAPYSSSSSLLAHLFTFIESSSPPYHWSASYEDESGLTPDAGAAKAFATIKSAVVRAVVECPNEDSVMNQLFEGEEGEKSWVVERLVRWVEEAKEGREDLMICAAHMLAALGRKDEHCVQLVQEYGLARPLAKLVEEKVEQQFLKSGSRPGEVTQILFGLVSLLRHLAIPVPNKQVLGETGIIDSVSKLLSPSLDIVTPLQNAVVGLLKHLTASNISNSLLFIGFSPSPPSSTALDVLLALIPRTDDVRLRSEASRTLVNVVRTLFSTRSSSSTEVAASPISPCINTTGAGILDGEEGMKRRGRPRIVREEVVGALSEMVRLSEKYPMLINEGIVGLTLLAGSGGIGALLVLEALLAPHAPAPPVENPSTPSDPLSPPPKRTASLAITAAGDPSTSTDMLSTWLGFAASSRLSSTDAPSGVRAEMVANACALIITVLRGAEVAKVGKERLDELRGRVLAPLKGVVESGAAGNALLGKTAGRALEVVEARE